MRRLHLNLCGLLLLCFAAAGCITDAETVVTPIPDIDDVDLPTEASWELQPRLIQLFPSSRFVREDGQTLLELRFEVLDDLGDSIKWPGTAQVELFVASNIQPIRTGQRLYGWRVDLLSVAQQRAHYDSVTRSYLLRLVVDEDRVAGRSTVLRAAFTSIEGQRFEAQMNIRPGSNPR